MPARRGHGWSRRLGEEAVAAHFAAMSTALDKVAAFGIERRSRIRFLGLGRRSVFDLVGDRPVADDRDRRRRISAKFLAGGRAMDDHFRAAPLDRNMPVILALLGVWYRNIWGFPIYAVLPYDQRLGRLPAYLQQLDMESNGKRVRMNGGDAAERDRADRLRRARHQRPARILSASPPGHGRRAVRFPGRSADRDRRGHPPGSPARPIVWRRARR